MNRSALLLAAIMGFIALGGSSLHAQSVGLEFYTDDGYAGYYYGPGYYDPYYYGPRYGYSSYRYAPRSYSYGPQPRTYSYRPAPTEETRAPGRAGSCGEFHYWNGQSCVDARVVPPNVND